MVRNSKPTIIKGGVMTKSEIIYQRVLQFKGLVNEINIKHYEQERFIEIVDAIFDDVFKDELTVQETKKEFQQLN